MPRKLNNMKFNILGALILLPFHAGGLLLKHQFTFYQNQGEVLHGCLVKQDRVSVGTSLNSWKGEPNSDVTKCALACSNSRKCDTFHVDAGKKCFLRKGGKLHQGKSASGGFCPKSKIEKRHFKGEMTSILWIPR